MAKLTQNRLRHFLNYNPGTGVFTWKVSRGGVKVGSQAGDVKASGYRYIAVSGKRYLASRLAWLFMEGYFPEHEMDHINRFRDDNRWENLRHVTKQCNARNSKRLNTNTSGITGVSWHKKTGKWRASAVIDGEPKHLGLFRSFINAVKARWQAEVEHGWPGCNSHTDAFCYLHGEG